MTRRLGHALLALAGLLVALYPVTIGAAPAVTCRGQVMQPGDTCAKADGSAVQTYEARAEAVGSARPVIVAVGVLVAGFGGYLLVSDLRGGPSLARRAH